MSKEYAKINSSRVKNWCNVGIQQTAANTSHADKYLTQIWEIIAGIKYLSKTSARQLTMLDFFKMLAFLQFV